MCAPETSRIALMLEPPRPITRLIRFADTIIFLDLKQYLEVIATNDWLHLQVIACSYKWLVSLQMIGQVNKYM